jgi:hypothetical protein
LTKTSSKQQILNEPPMSFALAVALSLAATQMFAAAGLSTLQWQKRVLVVFAEPKDPHLSQQLRLLEAVQPGLAERDLVVYAVSGSRVAPVLGNHVAVDAADLRQQLDPIGGFEVVLVGKDGGIKHRQDNPITPGDLFAIIDAMPMRASEIAQDR